MSLRKLPTIQNFTAPEGLESAPSIDAVNRWQPSLRIKNLAGSDPNVTTIDIFDQLGKDPWTGEGVSASDVAKTLEGAQGVQVNINSPGGNFFEGTAIYNLLAQHPHKVTVNVIGLAASAASIVAMAGDEVLMGPASFLMIHNAWNVVVGDRHILQSAVDTLTSIDYAIRDLYVAHTGKHAAKISQMMDDETWLNARDAIANNFASGMIQKAQVVEDPAAQAMAHPMQARRHAEAIFADAGMTRSQRRDLVAQLKGAPSAIDRTATEPGSLAEIRDELRRLAGSVKADAGDYRCGASSNLALDMSTAWDGPAAAGRMLDESGYGNGGTPDVEKAARGFLCYDADAAKAGDRTAFKEPFADFTGGELKAVRGGVRAAASRLPQVAGLSASVMDQARKVLDHYEAKFTAADKGTQNAADPNMRDAVLPAVQDSLARLAEKIG